MNKCDVCGESPDVLIEIKGSFNRFFYSCSEKHSILLKEWENTSLGDPEGYKLLMEQNRQSKKITGSMAHTITTGSATWFHVESIDKA